MKAQNNHFLNEILKIYDRVLDYACNARPARENIDVELKKLMLDEKHQKKKIGQTSPFRFYKK